MRFEEYVAARREPLLRTATAIAADRHVGEEVLQDVLMKLHGRWDRLDQVTDMDAYVRRMIVNEFISWRRKWARIVPTCQLPEEQSGDHSQQVVDRDELRREVMRLPRRQQVALALRYYDGLSTADIADAMGCRESSVRGFISRGLAALRIELSPATTTTGGAL